MKIEWMNADIRDSGILTEKHSTVYLGLKEDGTVIWKEVEYTHLDNCPKCKAWKGKGSAKFCPECAEPLTSKKVIGGHSGS